MSPDIPQKKVENAYASYVIPSSAKLFAIVDATVFGSAKNGLAFTSEGLFWKNDWSIESAKCHMTWEEFKSTAGARAVNGTKLLLGNGCVFGMSGSGMKPKILLQLMTNLAHLMQGAKEEPSKLSAVLYPFAVDEQVVLPKQAVSAIQVEDAPSRLQAEAPRSKPAFEGSYYKPHLHIINAVAKRHRLSSSIQIAPGIAVFKVRNVMEVLGNQIKPYDILMIVDDTFFRSAKNFLVVTAQCLWAKCLLRKSDHFPVSEIRQIRCKGKILYINDYDFMHFDQHSENEVLVMTNMLQELLEVLDDYTEESKPKAKQKLPRFVVDILSGAYKNVVDNTISKLEANDNQQVRNFISALTDCCFSAFNEVNSHMGNCSSDRAVLLGQHLLAQTLATAMVVRGNDELWSRVELQLAFPIIEGELLSQVLMYTEQAGLAMHPNPLWYLRIIQCVLEADTLENGLVNLQQNIGQVVLPNAYIQAVECGLESAEAIEELFCSAL